MVSISEVEKDDTSEVTEATNKDDSETKEKLRSDKEEEEEKEDEKQKSEKKQKDDDDDDAKDAKKVEKHGEDDDDDEKKDELRGEDDDQDSESSSQRSSDSSDAAEYSPQEDDEDDKDDEDEEKKVDIDADIEADIEDDLPRIKKYSKRLTPRKFPKVDLHAEEAEMIRALEKDDLKEKFAAHQEGKLVMPVKGESLENHLSEQDIKKFADVFAAIPSHSIDVFEFQDYLKEISHLVLPWQDVETLFMKMDTDHDGSVTWDEFLSFILLEMREKDIAGVIEELHQPLGGFPRLLKSQHRLPIVRVTFFPVIQPNRETSFLKGKYVTVSRDGMIHYWTLDFEREGTAYSECPYLRIRPTWITDMVTLPDVNIICTSSTERDLRFYDVTARKFDLRIIITLLHYPVTCMCYHFSQDVTRDSKLICGDMSGTILLFSFTTKDKGPFYHTPAKYLTAVRFDAVVKGELEHMTVSMYMRVHLNAWVKQVSFYNTMNCFLTCAPVSENSLCMFDAYMLSTTCKYAYNVPKGVNCFTIEESSHTLVTGDVDCTVRVWNVFVPHKSSCVFVGHHAPIIAVVTQNGGKRVFSLSKDKCIKVWDVPEQKCIQTYISMPSDLGGMYMSTLYNPTNRNLIVAAVKIAILVLGVVVDTERSDGFTHTMGVVRAMYNPLFKCIVTVGLDSLIMVWDPWEGQRKVLVRNAHTRSYYGDPTAVEITAAAFDPDWQQLITGARDGTLKVWNFNTGTCVRTMNIELFCEVTNIIWIKGRIMAVGWNRHVTEFSDNKAYNEGKVWETRHTDDVLNMALRDGQSVATSSYNGELLLWRLETGQAYRRYAVATPKARILLTYTPEAEHKIRGTLLYAGTVEGIRRNTLGRKEIMSSYAFHRSSEFKMKVDPSLPMGAPAELKDIVLSGAQQGRRRSRASISVSDTSRRLSMSADGRRMSLSFRHLETKTGHLMVARGQDEAPEKIDMETRKSRRVSVVRLPMKGPGMQQVSVTAMHFLDTRPMRPNWGTLFVAVDKGFIQVWSHHTAGGFIGFFLAIHMAGDYVCSMTSDPTDKYLFTGTTLGYIKVWLMENYGFPNCELLQICMPSLRLQFPFLWNDRVEGRAKRSLRAQKWPLLVNSYRGHLLAVHYIEYLHDHRVVLTCSPDATVRLWTLGGRYLGTLGSVHTWSLNTVDETQIRTPPDVKLVASSTTMKVLNGGDVPRTHFKLIEDSELLKDLPQRLVTKATYGKRASSPVLGKYFSIPRNDILHASHKIVYYGTTVPVYRYLKNFKVTSIAEPEPPSSFQKKERKIARGKGPVGFLPDADDDLIIDTTPRRKSRHVSTVEDPNKPREAGRGPSTESSRSSSQRRSKRSRGTKSRSARKSSQPSSSLPSTSERLTVSGQTRLDKRYSSTPRGGRRSNPPSASSTAASAAAAAVVEAATSIAETKKRTK